ncbi:MetQ/NlpA family ABC transporter substrate-binding protein [Aerococcaceae bacterium NML201209]|nr:MetQ/NlpA family ABC transporter substrate-binding protein [Aerococcaceae bacterium NML201209]MCW6664192.1 MetQ/NlpA family ABC transporter substrate-binding protein [Aerococcaceae bacterium NML191219]
MKKLFRTLLATAALVVGGGSLATPFVTQAAEPVKVKLGLTGDDTRVWDNVKERLAKEGIEIEYVKFTDYSQPNAALADGSIDLNAFQHQIFLDSYNAEHKTDIVSIGNTVNAPLGIYSDKIKDVKDLKEGAKIAIPNDPTNGGRALRLLQSAGLIKVDESKGYKPTVSDITENKLKLDIQELDASQTARALPDVDVAIINSGVAVDAGFLPTKDAIFLEPVDDKSKPYVNVIAVRKEDEQNDIYQKIVDFYQTDETKKVIEEVSKGSHIPAWETFGRK